MRKHVCNNIYTPQPTPLLQQPASAGLLKLFLIPYIPFSEFSFPTTSESSTSTSGYQDKSAKKRCSIIKSPSHYDMLEAA